MIDHITVIGNVATPPEKRRTANGTNITSFRLATSKRRPDDNGTWVDEHTNWYKVSTFRGLADHAFDSIEKGQRVIVTGTLKISKWESGEKHGTEVEIEADGVGHDLLWGTTVFRRDGQAALDQQSPDDDGQPDLDEHETTEESTLGRSDATDAGDGAGDLWQSELVGAAVTNDGWDVAPLGDRG